MEPSSPLLCHGPYRVTVLRGQRSDLRRPLEILDLRHEAYRLVGLFNGNGLFQEGTGGWQRISAPSALLVPPDGDGGLRLPAASHWEELLFDVVAVPVRARFHGRGPARVHVDKHSQPGPMAVWGVQPPWRIAPALVPPALEALRSVNQLWWRGPYQRLRANARLQVFLADLIASCAEEQDYGGDPAAAPSADPWLHRLEELLQAGLPDGLRVAEIAATLGLSRQYFRRRLLAATGKTPRMLIEDLRMAHARHLLEDGQAEAAVMAAIGLRSRSAFIAAFRRHFGTTPGRYRRLEHDRSRYGVLGPERQPHCPGHHDSGQGLRSDVP